MTKGEKERVEKRDKGRESGKERKKRLREKERG